MTTTIAPITATEVARALQDVPPATALPSDEVTLLVRWAIREARNWGANQAARTTTTADEDSDAS